MKLPKCMMNTLCLCLSVLLAAGPAVHAATPTPAKKGQARVTINLPPPGTSLGTVLKMITELSGMPLLTSPEIAKKPVSIYLPDVTGQQALDSVCETHDLYYEYQPDTGLYVVKQIASEVFLLERVNAEEIKDVVAVLIGDDLGQEVEVDGKNNVLAVRATRSALKAVQQFIDKVDVRPRQNVAYFALEHVQAKDVKTVIEALVGEQGKVEVDEKNNVLAVDSGKGNIETIRQLLHEVDVPPRQVLIEATLAELNDDASEELGILWNARVTFKGGARQTRFPFESKWLGGDSDVGWTFGEVSFKEFQVQLDAMETSGDAKILASPRIRVLHGEEAEINITTKTVVGTELSGEDETGLVNQKPIHEDVGVSLKVVPLIHSDGSITLKVEPSVSTAKESSFFEDQVDTFNRQATTTVSVTDGETIAIGGLLQNEERDKVTKIPVLGDIPFLGKAFTHTSKEVKKSDLVVFLTLHIIDPGEKTKRGAEGAAEAAVFDATDILVRYNTAVTLFNANNHMYAEPLLKELLMTPLDASRKHKIRQYLAAIDKERRDREAILRELAAPPQPEAGLPQEQIAPPRAEVPSQPVLTPPAVMSPLVLPPPPVVTPPPDVTPPPVLPPAVAPPALLPQQGSAIPPPEPDDVPADLNTAAELYQRGDYAQAKVLFQRLKQSEPEADYIHRVDAYLSSIEERTKHMEADLLATAPVGVGDTRTPSTQGLPSQSKAATPIDVTVPARSGPAVSPMRTGTDSGAITAITGHRLQAPGITTVKGTTALPAEVSIPTQRDITQTMTTVTTTAADSAVPLPVHKVTLEAPPVLNVPPTPPLSFPAAATRALDAALTPTATARLEPRSTPTTTEQAAPAPNSGRRLLAVVGNLPRPPSVAPSSYIASPLPGTAPTPTLRSPKPATEPAYNEAVWLYQTGKFGEAKRALTQLLGNADVALDQRRRIEDYLDIITKLGK